MITAAFAFAFIGATIGSVFINYILHEPNSKYDEDELYRNSGHHGPEN